MLDPETLKLLAGALGVLVANYLITTRAQRGKADIGEMANLFTRVNTLTSQNENQQRTIDRLQATTDRLARELEICHTHRDMLLVERDKLSQQLVSKLLSFTQVKPE